MRAFASNPLPRTSLERLDLAFDRRLALVDIDQ